jgi:DNA-binding FadR family transcriptional regulator
VSDRPAESIAIEPLASEIGRQRAAAASMRASIRVPKTAEIVADHIRSRIIRGELTEGDFLPPEGQLMASLGISRPTLREAFRILEAEALISVVRGSRTGAKVHQPRVDLVSRYAGFVLQAQGTTVSDIYDARLGIEPFITRRLAEARSPAVVARLREEEERLKFIVHEARYIDFMIALAEFHRLLVELGGNRTLLLITSILQDVVTRYQVEYFTRRALPDETQRKRSLWGLRSFDKLIRLIETGDADGAEAHWRLHLINSNASWVEPADADRLIDALG